MENYSKRILELSIYGYCAFIHAGYSAAVQYNLTDQSCKQNFTVVSFDSRFTFTELNMMIHKLAPVRKDLYSPDVDMAAGANFSAFSDILYACCAF